MGWGFLLGPALSMNFRVTAVIQIQARSPVNQWRSSHHMPCTCMLFPHNYGSTSLFFTPDLRHWPQKSHVVLDSQLQQLFQFSLHCSLVFLLPPFCHLLSSLESSLTTPSSNSLQLCNAERHFSFKVMALGLLPSF